MLQSAGATLALTSLFALIQFSDQQLVSDLQHDTESAKKLKIEVYPSSWNCEIDALEEAGLILDSCDEEAVDKDEFYVIHGGACYVVSHDQDVHMSFLEKVLCQYGRWSTSETNSALDLHHRNRRGWGWIGNLAQAVTGIGNIVSSVAGTVKVVYDLGCSIGWWCMLPISKSEIVTVVKKPPEYTTCPPSDILSEYFVPSGQEEMRINWISPNANDPNGSIQSNQQVLGTTNGGSFAGSSRPGGRQHTILYEAKDDDGMTAFCYFSFTVKVRTCDALLWPTNGRRDCNNDNILGSTCRVICNEGYSPANGISETTCSGGDHPQWSAEPSCEKISCTAPPDVTDGDVTCYNGHEYGDYCVISCRDGYRLHGQVFTRCEAEGNWFWSVPTICTDGIAPELMCKTPQIFYADRGSSSVAVVWDLPIATDNIDTAPTVTQTVGPNPGVVIPAGSSAYATYIATDASENQSPSCSIELRTEVTSCGHPLNTLNDERLRFTCTTTPQYIYGDTCTLTCAYNLPLEGKNMTTCERNVTGSGPPLGYWDWGGGYMPFCRDIACPPINPPRNGALVFDWVNSRPITTMLCNENWDIPDLGAGFNGIFLCQDSGLWNPNYETAPGCTETFSTRGYFLPSEFFYYGGVCGVNDTILENFADIIADLSEFFSERCPEGTICKPQNPQVICGEYDRRKRRSANEASRVGKYSREEMTHLLKKRQTTGPILIFTFDVAIYFNTSQMSNDEQWEYADYVQLELLKPEIQKRVLNGTYDRTNWDPLTNDSFQTADYGVPHCDPGSVLVRQTKCNKCPVGHYEHDGECVKCQIGTYSDTIGSVACNQCPIDYSTRQLASDTLDNCTQLCTPGTYSPDTFAPCAQCEAGTYQPQTGQTQCLPCPMGTSTKSVGSTAETDCQAYDAIVTDTSGYVLTVGISSLTNLGLEVFIKTVSGTPDIVISVNGELDVTIAETITVSTASTTDDIGASSNDAWIPVSIYWDTTTGEFKAYYRGNLVVSHSSIIPDVTPLVQNGHLYISASGDAVIMISGLRLHEALIEASVDNDMATTCQNIDDTDVINMEDLKYLEGITLIVPSVCDVADECLSSPCGEHNSKCTNKVDGFVCTCKGGWTGDTCDTPPDYCLGNDCQNGATCISGLTNYTCNCEPGYSGVNCEKPPVNGGWSVWSSWTECSATCNTGSRDRNRSCDSPAPDPHGQDCKGVDRETEECNKSPCRVCPRISRGHAAIPVCEENNVTDSIVCTVACRDGYIRPPGLEDNDTYTCGTETDHKWQPRQNIPACIDPNRPERYYVSISASMDQTVLQSDQQGVISGITSNLATTACYNSASHCSADVQIGSAGRRRKRNTGTTVTITFTVALNDTSDLQLDQLAQNGTISPGLQEIIDAINDLEATAVAINDSASTYFDVTTDGMTYTVDTHTVTFDGAATCSEGQVVTGGLCAACPAGSYQISDYCSLCEKGTYQGLTGQAVCVRCPYGFTTETVGSDASSDCSVQETTTTSSSTTTTSTTQTTTTSTTSTTPSSTTSLPSSKTSTTLSTKSTMTSTTSTPLTTSATPSSTTSTTSTTPSTTTPSTTSSTDSTTSASPSTTFKTTPTTSTTPSTTSTASSTTSTTPSTTSTIPSTTSTSTLSTTSTNPSTTSTHSNTSTIPSTTSTILSLTSSTTQSTTASTSSSSPTASTTSSTTSTKPSSNDGVLIIVVVSVLAALIVCVIVVIVCIKKRNAGRAKIDESTPPTLLSPNPKLRSMTTSSYKVPQNL